jgi:hypothetical protein
MLFAWCNRNCSRHEKHVVPIVLLEQIVLTRAMPIQFREQTNVIIITWLEFVFLGA